MLRHVVLLGWTADATAEQRQAVLDGLGELPGKFPHLISDFAFGADAGLVDGNYDLAVVADFDAYLRYATEPEHVAFIERTIRPILARRAAIQFKL